MPGWVKSLRCKIHDWYGLHDGYNLLLRPGYTALVGPNGAGKTTLLCQLAEIGEKRGYRVLRYSNLADGNSMAAANIVEFGSAKDFAELIDRSEGESIVFNFGNFITQIGMAVRKMKETGTTLLVLLDGLDSGTSIDMQRNMMDFFQTVERDACVYPGGAKHPIFIIAAVNAYEMTRSGCIDVRTGESLSFGDYSEYARFICGYFEK